MQKSYTTLLVLFVAFVSSTLIYLLLGFFLLQTNFKTGGLDASVGRILTGIFLGISVALVFLVQKVRRSAYSEDLPRPESLESLQRFLITRHIVAYALSEAPAIMGLTLFLLSGNFLELAGFCCVSIVAFLAARPSLKALEEMKSRFNF